MALLVMFNNFFHDLMAALWMCGAILTWLLYREVRAAGTEEVERFFRSLAPRLLRLNSISLLFVVLFGIVRSATYYSYEYQFAAGRGQVIALIVKHILLFAAVGVGLLFHMKVRREISSRG